VSAAVLAPVERHLVTLNERYHTLSLRERALIGISLFATTWMVWSATVGGFLEESKARISRDLDTSYAQMQAEVAEQSRLRKQQASDPNAKLNQERSLLDSELESLNADLGSELDRFVPPEKMPELLKDVIRHHDGLKLKRMASLPVEPILLEVPEADKQSEEDTPAEPPPAIYRHPLRLEFEGGYFQVLAYLAELEASDWKFGWRQLSYEVGDYPKALVTLEIETLSREKSWIGV
jgi:MSHA biogenesis protein MshJ